MDTIDNNKYIEYKQYATYCIFSEYYIVYTQVYLYDIYVNTYIHR